MMQRFHSWAYNPTEASVCLSKDMFKNVLWSFFITALNWENPNVHQHAIRSHTIMKLRNRQNESVLMEVRIMVVLR